MFIFQNVIGQQGIINGSPGQPQQNIPNFKNFNQMPINSGAGIPNIPQQNFSPQVMPATNNLQTTKQVNLQAPNKPVINGQQHLNVQQINLKQSNSPPAVNLQIPKQSNQLQIADMNLVVQSPKSTNMPSPVPLEITSFNFIPVDQMPFGPPTQLTFIPNAPMNLRNAQVLPPSLQTPNFVSQNSMTSSQIQQPTIQNSVPPLQNHFSPNQLFISQPSLGSVQNQIMLPSFPNQPFYESISPALVTLQAQPPSFSSNQPGIMPVQGQPIHTTLFVQNQQPTLPIQVEPVITYQSLPEPNSLQGSATYIPFNPQYTPTVPLYAQFTPYGNPTPKTKKSSGLKAILPYLINLLQERQRCPSPCPNCGCIIVDEEPQIFGNYANQKSYGGIPNEQNLPAVKIDSEDLQTKARFLREHKNPKKSAINTESDERSDEDSNEVTDDGEDDTSDSH